MRHDEDTLVWVYYPKPHACPALLTCNPCCCTAVAAASAEPHTRKVVRRSKSKLWPGLATGCRLCTQHPSMCVVVWMLPQPVWGGSGGVVVSQAAWQGCCAPRGLVTVWPVKKPLRWPFCRTAPEGQTGRTLSGNCPDRVRPHLLVKWHPTCLRLDRGKHGWLRQGVYCRSLQLSVCTKRRQHHLPLGSLPTLMPTS